MLICWVDRIGTLVVLKIEINRSSRRDTWNIYLHGFQDRYKEQSR